MLATDDLIKGDMSNTHSAIDNLMEYEGGILYLCNRSQHSAV